MAGAIPSNHASTSAEQAWPAAGWRNPFDRARQRRAVNVKQTVRVPIANADGLKQHPDAIERFTTSSYCDPRGIRG
jgi:hypothetical protein